MNGSFGGSFGGRNQQMFAEQALRVSVKVAADRTLITAHLEVLAAA